MILPSDKVVASATWNVTKQDVQDIYLAYVSGRFIGRMLTKFTRDGIDSLRREIADTYGKKPSDGKQRSVAIKRAIKTAKAKAKIKPMVRKLAIKTAKRIARANSIVNELIIELYLEGLARGREAEQMSCLNVHDMAYYGVDYTDCSPFSI